MRLDPPFQVSNLRPGSRGLTNGAVSLSEQELKLGKMLLLELTEELWCTRVIKERGEDSHLGFMG
jgi:hypothetical protein